MTEDMLIRHCAPTLAGLKTANMVNVPYTSEAELTAQLNILNDKLNPKGVRLELLTCKGKTALVYVCRPDKLDADLCSACDLLDREGYPGCERESCLSCLKARLSEKGDFPHEIGLFLGYPPEDVDGFIQNRGQSCKCVGAWKVYGDAEEAEKTFARFRKCTDIYQKRHEEGFPVSKLTIQGKAC